MSTERDSTLQHLFDKAKQDLLGDAFVAQVVSRIDSLRRRALIGWSFVGLVLATCAWLLVPPLLEAVQLITQLLPETLIEFDDAEGIVTTLLSPVNSIAGAFGLVVLGLLISYKKFFS